MKALLLMERGLLVFDKPSEEFTTAISRRHFAQEVQSSRNQDNRTGNSKRMSTMETTTSTVLVSCDGLGGYDRSDQAEEGPNYALMAFSSSILDLEVSNDSNCLESVEEKLEFYKRNESIYVKNINDLKWDSQVGEITIKEIRKKLENASNSLNKLIECQIVDNYKKDEFFNKPVVENRQSDEEVSKVVRKSDDSLIIKDWVSDNKEENVSQTETEKKIVKPSIAKTEFVKPKQQEKTARKTVKQVEKDRQTLTFQEAIKKIRNNLLSKN
ncbi:hypothetical protein Tco_0163094 [Tanacetum coccineum]